VLARCVSNVVSGKKEIIFSEESQKKSLFSDIDEMRACVSIYPYSLSAFL
jgi:hypothetical protein